eukprot:4093681-Pleurochrysis_carterae.AAC.1
MQLDETPRTSTSMLPPLANSITGLNYQPAARQREVAANTMQTLAAAMPTSFPADQIMLGQLYFVNIPEFEGELCMGVGRAEAELSEEGT